MISKSKRVLIAAAITAAIFILGACDQIPVVSTTEPTQTDAPTPTKTEKTPTATPTTTSTPTNTPFPTATIESCLLIKGELIEQEIYVGGMSEAMTFYVYLPPCYDDQTERDFPILYMLHGKDFGKDQWVRLGLISTANEMIAGGQISPMIIVLPEDVNADYPEDDLFDEDIVNDVIPYIEENYRVEEGRENKAMGGLSRGANWAMQIGLNYPETFGALGLHSLAISAEYEEGEIEAWLDEIEPGDVPRIYLDHGDEEFDLLKNSIAEFMSFLDDRDFGYEFNEFLGAHDEVYWSSYIDRYLLFYASIWKE